MDRIVPLAVTAAPSGKNSLAGISAFQTDLRVIDGEIRNNGDGGIRALGGSATSPEATSPTT